jgi:hypothetical protein
MNGREGQLAGIESHLINQACEPLARSEIA